MSVMTEGQRALHIFFVVGGFLAACAIVGLIIGTVSAFFAALKHHRRGFKYRFPPR